MVPNYHAKAKNPLIADQYDALKPTSFILYTDCNNLYATALSQPLPYADFRWLDRNEINSLDVRTLSDDGDMCYVLEIDLHYPPELHDLHSDYPLAQVRSCVNPDTLSPYSRRFHTRLQYTKGDSGSEMPPSSVHKLLRTLDDKQK